MNKLIICSLVILLFLSCDGRFENQDSVVIYTIKNISTHNVKLIVFYNNSEDISNDTIFTIPLDAELKQSYINQYPDCPFGLPADSSFIVFDENKQIIYRKNDGRLRNILDINSFEGGLVNGELYQYQYNITNQDYANAIEIK